MAFDHQIPGGPYLNEVVAADHQIPGGPFANETASTGGATITLTVGTATQAQQAGTKLVEAQIPGAALVSAQKAFFTDQNGISRVFVPGKGYVGVAEWRKLGSPMPVASKELRYVSGS